MKKINAFNQPTLSVILFVSLFINFGQSTKAQTRHEDSTPRQNAGKPKIVIHKTGEPAELLYDFGKGRFLVDSADTHGAWSLVEVTEQPGLQNTASSAQHLGRIILCVGRNANR